MKLLSDLNADVLQSEELEIATLELAEPWSYARTEKNPQWLWPVFFTVLLGKF